MRLVVTDLQSALAGPFNLELEAGRCAAISGASGSGKSLFLRMVADLDSHGGEVRLDGVAARTLPAPDWRRRVPYVAAESGWWRDTAIDHFAAADREAARALAARLGVGSAQVDGPAAQMSTGERQRLALVRAFVLNSPVLLLDEPTGPLDPEATTAVEAYLRERMAGGTAVLIVTHDPRQALRLGADHYRMADRHLTRMDPAAVLEAAP
ncbi:MAG TPA: ABC transporter ATP-binding protein [Caulobacteraceae bacterium]